MAKRFTDSDKWKDEWFLTLNNDMRIVWLYLVDNCTIAGRLKKNFKLLNYYCNTELNPSSFQEIFTGRVFDLGEYYFIPKFLKFQYPQGLQSNKPLIVGVRKELLQNNLIERTIQSLGNDYPIIANDKPIITQSLPNDYGNGNGNGNEKGQKNATIVWDGRVIKPKPEEKEYVAKTTN